MHKQRLLRFAMKVAFSDYQVSVDMPFKSFETMLKRNGFMPAVSDLESLPVDTR